MNGHSSVYIQHHGISAELLLLKAGDVEVNPGPGAASTVVAALDCQAASVLVSWQQLARDVRQHTASGVITDHNSREFSTFKLDPTTGDMIVSHMAITWGIDTLLSELKYCTQLDALRVLGAFSGVARAHMQVIPEHDWDQQFIDMGLEPLPYVNLPWWEIYQVEEVVKPMMKDGLVTEIRWHADTKVGHLVVKQFYGSHAKDLLERAVKSRLERARVTSQLLLSGDIESNPGPVSARAARLQRRRQESEPREQPEQVLQRLVDQGIVRHVEPEVTNARSDDEVTQGNPVVEMSAVTSARFEAKCGDDGIRRRRAKVMKAALSHDPELSAAFELIYGGNGDRSVLKTVVVAFVLLLLCGPCLILRMTRFMSIFLLLLLSWFAGTTAMMASPAVHAAVATGIGPMFQPSYGHVAVLWAKDHDPVFAPSSLAVVDAYTPLGELHEEEDQPFLVEFDRDPDGLWLYGKYAGTDREKLAAVVRSNKSSFAYSMAELPGYSGKKGPVNLKVVHDKPIY